MAYTYQQSSSSNMACTYQQSSSSNMAYTYQQSPSINMAYTYQQSSSSNSKNEPGHPEKLQKIAFSSESSASSASSVRLGEYNLRSQHETIPSGGGIEQPGPRPPPPDLPPRLSLCPRCNVRVCIKDIRREMLKTDVLKLVRVPVPNDPTSFRYVCPVCLYSPNVRHL